MVCELAMSESQRGKSSKVFSAVSAPLRFGILRLLYSQGPLNYSEIMGQLNLSPGRDAGKFAYHLRTLVRAELVSVDKKTKKYMLAPLGNMMIGFGQNIEEQALKGQKRLLVRTSRLVMEEFDHNKIASALNKEAGVPSDLAQKIAEETEDRLLKLGTLYLTAPLIREFVNAVLIEKGLHEYRHKLTRLGLPVYDVTQLIRSAEVSSVDVESISKLTGKNVMTEYVFLNVLPRGVADAHLSGFLHVNDADSWVLRLNEFQHDLRVFLKNGFKPNGSNTTLLAFSPPKTFENALTMAIAIIRASSTELAGEQGISHFNLFLAPYTKSLSLEEIRDSLRRFLFNLNQTASRGGVPADVSLGLDFAVPENLERLEATGVKGEKTGFYSDYQSEASRILSVLIDLMFEDDVHQPMFSPYLVFNMSPTNLMDKDIESLVLKAHELAAKRGTPYFINSSLEYQKSPSYFATGSRMNSDWTGDWELDAIRTGSLGNIAINLPRLAYEAKGSDSKLLSSLDEYVQMVIEALSIKYQALEERIKWSLLPFLSQPVSGEPYLRIRDSSLNINLIGLNEAIKAHTGSQLHENKRALDLGLKVIGNLALQSKALSWKSGFRVTVANDAANNASQRFAKMDVERYGWGTVFIQGSRETPYYTDLTMVPLEAELSLKERLDIILPRTLE